MNSGSGGEAVGSMEDANDEMWEGFLALPDMDQDSSAEWSEGPRAALAGAGSKRQRMGAGDSNDVGDGEDVGYGPMYKKHFTHIECVERRMCSGDSSLSCISVTVAFTCCVFCNHQRKKDV